MTTIDVYDMPNSDYRAVLDRMGVETQPEPGIYLHVTAQTDFGYRIIEIWDTEEGFEEFAQRRMLPALEHLGIDRKTEITVKPLHNLFAPRLAELPGLVDGLPGAPGTRGRAIASRLTCRRPSAAEAAAPLPAVGRLPRRNACTRRAARSGVAGR